MPPQVCFEQYHVVPTVVMHAGRLQEAFFYVHEAAIAVR